MATNRLQVPATTPLGSMLVEAVDHLVSFQQLMLRIRGIFGQIVRSPNTLVDADFIPLGLELFPGATEQTLTPAQLQTAKDLFYLQANSQDKSADALLIEFAQRCDQG